MLEIGRAGVQRVCRLQADLRRAGGALTGPLLWWGTASSGPCSFTGPNSSTQCTFGQHYGIHTLKQTEPWWSRSSAGYIYSTA